jgi:alanine racemase
MHRKTIVEINLGAIKHNLLSIREKTGAGTKILLAVKADGYGHGAVQVSKCVEKNGLADILGVSSPSEGIELRNAGITLPILILGLILPREDAIKTLFDHDLSQTVADLSLASLISKEAVARKKRLNLHLKVDTGMGRIGCPADKAVDIASSISRLDGVNLEGIFSHFPVSDDPDSDFTRKQIEQFKKIHVGLEEKNIRVPLRHMANSAAIFNYTESIFNMVRPGIMAYGYMPSHSCRHSISIIPAMTMMSCIVFVKRVRKGTPLSYGLIYSPDRDSNIATIPVGYGDGYSRSLSNKAQVIIKNKKYPVVGRVCMDQILVNLGDDEFDLGEEVTLFGGSDITAETIADWMGSIPYEVTCAISKRVPRIYTGG